MTPIDNYQKTEANIRLLLQGPPKSGKTVLASHFPKAYIIDIDVNLGGPLAYMKGIGSTLPVGYDVVDRDDKGQPIPIKAVGPATMNRFKRLIQLINAADSDPAIGTIVIDSATTLVDLVTAEVLQNQSKETMDKQLWGFFFSRCKQFMAELSKIRKHVILIAHERAEKDEIDQMIRYNVAWPGQFGDIIAAFFTDVWRCEVQLVPSGLTPTYKWNVRTKPDPRFNLGGSLSHWLPPVFEFKWPLVEAAIKKVIGEVK